MTDDPLKIVEVQKGLPHRTQSTHPGTRSREARDQEARAYFDRQWLLNPEKFDPARSARETERIDRTWTLLKPLLEFPELVASDLGFGWGVLTRKMVGRGARVDAVDVAENALKHFVSMGECDATLIRDALPMSSLSDDAYDVVVCTDLIAELKGPDQRLLVSELYRIAKPTGHVVMSTPLDYRTDGALERFAQLVDTELEVLDWEVSHHAYFLRLMHLLEGPERYVLASNDIHYYRQLEADRGSIRRAWLKVMTIPPCSWLWKGVNFILRPIRKFLSRSRAALLFVEGICRAISPDGGVTHAICVAKLKSLNTTEPVDVQKMEPQVQNMRQRVWE